MPEFQNLTTLLHKQSTSEDRHGVWNWKAGKNGVFSINSYYRKLLIREEVAIPYNSSWISILSLVFSLGYQLEGRGDFDC